VTDDDDRERLGPPPIDPLPDLAWARVERNVLAELDGGQPTRVDTRPAPTGRRWVISVGIGAALGAAAAIALLVIGIDGDDAARDPNGAVPTRIATGDAPSDVGFGDAHVVVAPGSALVLSGTGDSGVLAILDRGSARFSVAPRRGRPPYVVQAGAVAVRVVGTEFTVTRDGDDASVAVVHGSVEVVYRGKREAVSAGSTWSSRTTIVATPEHQPEPEMIETPAPSRPTRPPSPADSITEQDRFEAAARLEASDPAAALAGYRELARGRSAWAGNALYAVGRLSHERGDRAAAQRALAEYLRRFPRGANAADAHTLLARIEGESR
jgi:hypothetical protein